jgi:hypothetical protein
VKDKKRLTEGDIFYVCIHRKYIFGKILLDIRKRILKLEPKHKYWFYNECFLVVVYKYLYDEPKLTDYEIIVPSTFVLKNCFNSTANKSVDWIFYENKPIDYKKLDFPETLETGENGFLDFRKFDVVLPTKTLFQDFWSDQFNQKYTGNIHFSYYSLIDDALHL